MLHSYRIFARSLESIQRPLSPRCLRCVECCRSYAWAMDVEVPDLLGAGLVVCKINGRIYAIDSFPRNADGTRETGTAPRCRYSSRGRCLCYMNRPVYCRLYPIIPSRHGDHLALEWDLECPYVDEAAASELESIETRALDLFRGTANDLVQALARFYGTIYDVCPGMEKERRRAFRVDGALVVDEYRVSGTSRRGGHR